MPVPKRKTSKSRRDKRSSTWGIRPGPLLQCQTCQAPIGSHQACRECGYYKGVKILRTKTDRMHHRGEARRVAKEVSSEGTKEAETQK